MRTTTRNNAIWTSIVVLALAACGGSSEDSVAARTTPTVEDTMVEDTTTPSLAEESSEPIVLAALIGAPAEGGPDFENGMRVAIAAINEAGGIGGRAVELRTFSTESTAAGAVAAYREAAADQEIVASFFGAVSGALAVKAASDEVGLPIVIATASDEVDVPLAREVFKNSFSGEYATSSLTYAAGQQAVQRVAELHFGTDYSVGIPDALESRCQELGCEIVASESADAGAPVDALIPQLTNMASANPDVYFIEGLNPNAFAAARQLGITAPIISDQWLAIPALRDACGVNCDDVVFAIHKANVLELLDSGDPLAPVLTAYRAAFEAEIGSWAGFSIYGNDAVVALTAAARSIVDDGASITRESMIVAMESLDGETTTHGLVSTSADDHRLVGSWPESYIDVVIEASETESAWVLAPGADPAGSRP